ncbi:hypothetical protein LTR70_007295 [Exophiala xenobiotica]|uniref:Uncharacterized protein n=1 Tax=Lithohypha guttulata TaxID=1690604 RepID=A0ABR0K2C2_9EURO|nr:hypothetical protein LTR24_007638 [Lithohypha guttulata]KAK5314154.1 hypothetical protein LTR70_007295 [Exophiala xenobiotica]
MHTLTVVLIISHRTAVLIIFDYLAAVGVDVTRSPLRVHRLIADRIPASQTGSPDAKALQAVEKEIRDRNYKPEGGLTEDQRFSYAAEIKAADQIQDKLDQIEKLLQAEPNQEARTQVIQKIRKDYGLWLWEVYKRRAKTGRF